MIAKSSTSFGSGRGENVPSAEWQVTLWHVSSRSGVAMLNNNNNNKGKEKAQDKAIQDKIDDLPRAVDRLKHLQAHDALVILKNSMAIPKLLYLLRTSQCSDNPLLRQFDDTLLTGLITILNVDINNDQWLQATLPVGDGGQ